MLYRNILAAAAMGSAVAFGSMASAESTFGNQMVADMDAKVVTLDVVTADADGYVVIYDYTGGEIGEAFGHAEILMGANSEVVVGIDGNVVGDLLAVLYEGAYDETMMPDPATGTATLEIDVQDS